MTYSQFIDEVASQEVDVSVSEPNEDVVNKPNDQLELETSSSAPPATKRATPLFVPSCLFPIGHHPHLPTMNSP